MVQINLLIDGEKTSSLILPLHEINIEKLCQIRGQWSRCHVKLSRNNDIDI